MLRWLGPVLVLAAILGAVSWTVGRSARRGSFADEGSTYRASAGGSRALYLVAEGAGLPVERRHVDLEVVEHAGTLVLVQVPVASCADDEDDHEARFTAGLKAEGLSAAECGALLEWVAGGGSLVHVVEGSDPLVAALGLVFTPEPPQEPAGGEPLSEARLLRPGQPTPLAPAGIRVRTPVAGWLASPGGQEVRVLVEASHGAAGPPRAAAVAIPFGDGWALVAAAPALASNAWIDDGDNAAFWVGALSELTRTGTMAFDEYHHGHQGGRSLSAYAFQRGFGPAAAQVFLVFFLATLAGRRLGRPLPRPEDMPRSAADYVSAMSRLYQVGRHRTHAAHLISDRALRLARTAGARPGLAPVVESLEGARLRLDKQTRSGADLRGALWEVARRAAAVYHALSSVPARRRPRARGRGP